jgi:hypothetical protein
VATNPALTAILLTGLLASSLTMPADAKRQPLAGERTPDGAKVTPQPGFQNPCASVAGLDIGAKTK